MSRIMNRRVFCRGGVLAAAGMIAEPAAASAVAAVQPMKLVIGNNHAVGLLNN